MNINFLNEKRNNPFGHFCTKKSWSRDFEQKYWIDTDTINVPWFRFFDFRKSELYQSCSKKAHNQKSRVSKELKTFKAIQRVQRVQKYSKS